MKKPLLIVACVAVVALGAYLGTREEKSSFQVIQAEKAPAATIQALKANGTIPNDDKPAATAAVKPQPGAAQSAPVKEPPLASEIQQTQNAVDFNAPGAGTAEQKSGAAAAAVKAYKEAQEQSHR